MSKIAMQCFENFGGGMPQMLPPWLRALYKVLARPKSRTLGLVYRIESVTNKGDSI